MEDKFPARLHVIIAREAETAVVIWQGPSKLVCSIGWNLSSDTFEIGQWLKGRIYEKRCDLSPDGQYFAYFAMNGKWTSPSRGSWTAISRTPYLKADAFFPKGDCWNGGGLFTSNSKFWLNDGPHLKHILQDKHFRIRFDTKFSPKEWYGNESPGIYYLRLMRDGWEKISDSSHGEWHDITIFEKKLSQKSVLRKICHSQLNSTKGKGSYWDEHQIELTNSGEVFSFPDWEWADLHSKDVLFAEKGVLYRWRCSNDISSVRNNAVKNFNSMKFEPIKAPY